MNKGVIYVLTNPSFKEYVKIGYATNLEKRLKQLNRSECLPFAFRVYCVYEVEGELLDKEVHNLIDNINHELRAVETFDGKPRVREFYNMTAQDAYDILYSIAAISNTLDRLKKMTPNGHEVLEEAEADQMADAGGVVYSEEDHFTHSSINTKQLYLELKKRMLLLPDITVTPKKYYIAFKYHTNVCDMEIQKGKLKIHINMVKGELKDKLEKARDVSSSGHWGNGDYQLDITDMSELDYAMELIRQSYNKQVEE